MGTELIILTALGIVQLTINIATMFMALPAKYSVRFSIGVLTMFTVLVFGILFLTGSIYNRFVGLSGLVYLPLILWLFKGHSFQKVFAFFLQYLLTALQISLAVTVVSLLTGNENAAATVVGQMTGSENITDIVFIFILSLCMFAAYTALMLHYGRLAFQKLFIPGRPTEWALYSFSAVFSFVLMVVIRNTSISAWQHILVLLFILWSFINVCYAIISTHEKSKHRYEAEFARDIITSGRGHYQKMNEIHDELRVLRHDYKYHLDTISELLQAGNTEDMKEYLADVRKQLSDKELPNHCSNPVLNALLSSYGERCAKLGIKLVIEISMPERVSIPNYEMCIILGNLLENAVEACKRKDGKIELIINTQGAHLAVMVKNDFDGVVVCDNGRPLSGKKDGGLGLRSVQAVASRYGGELMTEWDGTTFTAYVLLRLELS